VLASGTDSGNVSQILSANTSRGFFEQSGTRTSRPACATATRWVIDTSTLAGQAMFSQLLTAYSLGRKVYISGTGDCALWGDSEGVAGIMMAN
jgi:hypothetical protein